MITTVLNWLDCNFVYLICLCIVEIFGDFSLRNYTKTWKIADLMQGIGWYGAVIYFLIKSLTGSTVLYVNGMWDGMSGLIESLAAYWYLGERLENPLQYAGLVFTIVGIVLLKRKDG